MYDGKLEAGYIVEKTSGGLGIIVTGVEAKGWDRGDYIYYFGELAGYDSISVARRDAKKVYMPDGPISPFMAFKENPKYAGKLGTLVWEAKSEDTITIRGKKYSESTIHNALREYIGGE